MIKNDDGTITLNGKVYDRLMHLVKREYGMTETEVLDWVNDEEDRSFDDGEIE